MRQDTPSTARKSKRVNTTKLVSFIILLIVSALFLFPFIYMLGVSFKSETDMIVNPNSIFPGKGGWTLDNYTGFIIRDGHLDNVPKWMFNSFLIAIIGIVVTILICSLAAYAFVFLRFKGRTVLFTALIFTMTIPGVIGTTAMYSMYAKIGIALDLLNNPVYIYFWLIMPGTSGVFTVYMLRNALLAIPKDIVESARADGANNFRIYSTIVLPVIRSTLLLITLFSFTGSWNSLIWPQLLLNGKDQGLFTITVALTGYTNQQDGWNAKAVAMATSAFSMIPIFIVFIFAQRKMIDGMATTGVKG